MLGVLTVPGTQAAWTDPVSVSGTAISTGTLAAPTNVAVSQSCNADPTPVRRTGAAGTTTTFGATSGSITIARPTGATAGDVLVAGILASGNYSFASLTAPSGWTLQRRDASNQGGQFVYTHLVGASEPASYAWSNVLGDASGGIAAFTGVDRTTPVNAANGAMASSSGTIVAPSVTTTRANVLLVAVFGLGAAVNQTPQASMSSIWSGFSSSGLSIMAAQESWPTAGATGTRTATGASGQSVGQMIALQPPRYPYVTTTWTPSTSTSATGQLFTRSSGGTVQVQASLDPSVTTRTGGPLTSGTPYTNGVAATLNNWISTTSSITYTAISC